MFAKVFKSIYYGSLRREPVAREVFVFMLCHSDRHGVVEYVTPEMIATLIGRAYDEVQVAIGVLESPDPESGTPTEDGRRLVRLTRGWRIVNYLPYRGTRDEEDRREQNRQAQARHRVTTVSQESATSKPPSAHAEAEAEAEGDVDTRGPSDPSPVGAHPKGIGPLGAGPYALPCRGGFWNPSNERMAAFEKAFGFGPVMDEWPRMYGWLVGNRRRLKTRRGMPRFVAGWLLRASGDKRTARAGSRSDSDQAYERANREAS